jgi:hypothetical protein
MKPKQPKNRFDQLLHAMATSFGKACKSSSNVSFGCGGATVPGWKMSLRLDRISKTAVA